MPQLLIRISAQTDLIHTIARPFRDLHREPADWSLARYARHAGRVSLGVWAAMLLGSVAWGLAVHNPRKPFGETHLFTFYTTALLAISGCVCWQCSQVTTARMRRVWQVLALALMYLALDELCKIHERFDLAVHWALRADPEHWLTDELDDAILVLYSVLGIALLATYGRPMVRLRGTKPGMLGVGVLFAVMLLFDLLNDHISGPVEARLEAAGVPDVQDALREQPEFGTICLTAILEDSAKGLAIAILFWTFVTARFQLRRKHSRREGGSDQYNGHPE